MTEPDPLAPAGIDTTVFPVDRETAERRLAVLPGWRTSAAQNRRFHGRAIRLLAQAGITQFLDIGAGLPAGSYLIASHPTQDFDTLQSNTGRSEQASQVGSRAGVPVWLRTRAEFTGFFAGLDLLDPGVVLVSDWRPEAGQPRPDPHLVTCYGAVARTPC